MLKYTFLHSIILHPGKSETSELGFALVTVTTSKLLYFLSASKQANKASVLAVSCNTELKMLLFGGIYN